MTRKRLKDLAAILDNGIVSRSPLDLGERHAVETHLIPNALGAVAGICLVIGGADGLSPAIKQRADVLLRLSALTLPHGMVRVLLAEQLYRAVSILNNHPYHRE